LRCLILIVFKNIYKKFKKKKKKKKKKGAKNHPADDTLARPLLQIRYLDMNSPAKTKEITKKSK
jgi:hypothetical protein